MYSVEAAVVLRVRHRQVARQDVVERRDVGRALDRRVAAQRDDAAAGPPDVAEQELDDRRGADQLDADRVLRPADRVDERAGPLAAGVVAERLATRGSPRRCSRTRRRRTPACSARSAASGSGRRSADAASVQSSSGGSLGRAVARALPPLSTGLLGRFGGCPPRRSMPRTASVVVSYVPCSGSQPEKSPSRSSVSANSSSMITRRVRVARDVLVEPAVVLEDVVDDAAEERDVAAGADAAM